MQPLRVRIPPAFDLTYAPPINLRRVSVLLVACHHAALAADALRHVKVKPVLLARLQSALWNSRFADVYGARTMRRSGRIADSLGGEQKSCALLLCALKQR